MKLLFCKKCQDVIRLVAHEERSCMCKQTSGHYINHINAIYSGENAIPIGFDNVSFADAIKNQPIKDIGERFAAFVIPKNCDTFVLYDKEK